VDGSEQHKQQVHIHKTLRVTNSYLSFHRSHVYSLFDELIHKPWGCSEWCPATDILETEEAFIIEIDLPGVESDDIDIHVQGNMLIIQGKRVTQWSEEVVHVHLQERSKGEFTRAFEFEQQLDENRIEHSWRNGVLILVVAKVNDK
jgi:HSP20 family molecular chaperone IbpA